MDLASLKLEDLYVVCDKCNGAKNITTNSAHNSNYGTQRISSFGPCDKCNGMGGQLTETGKVLKQFIQMIETKQIW